MSYLNKLKDVETLAHELGHGVHGSLSREQTYFNFNGTLPMAELASIFAEMLVFEDLIKEANDHDRLALLADKIEGAFASVFRQIAMYRFERRAHQQRREMGELSADDFGDIWQEELQAMFGSSIELSENHRIWWTYVGHFFFAPFYVYAYAFGELLTMSLYQQSKREGAPFVEKYEKLLRLGGAQSPQELIGIVGVDLTSREFWQGGLDAIKTLVDDFEATKARVAG
jgi:oligoendopeptidase F